MASKSDEFTNLKTEGNAFFLSGDSAKAAEIYTTLLENYDRERAILFTNRSAARLNLGLIEEALADAEQAIGHDKKWIKAYYRKASSLKLLKRLASYRPNANNSTSYYPLPNLCFLPIVYAHRPKDVFDTWMTASDECDSASSPWLLNQIDMARIEWMKIFRDVPVVDDDDFISRYEMLIESREKLSTMAHFWNGSYIHTISFEYSL